MADDIIVVGKVGAPYGVLGWSKINSYTEPAHNIMDYQPWLIGKPSAWREIDVVPAKRHGKIVVAKLPDSPTRDTAKAYTHTLIAVRRGSLPALADDEYYWNDLIGMSVVDTHGKSLGHVTSMMETGSHDVLVIRGDKDIAIPMILDDVVKEVDQINNRITVDWDLELGK